ncbi:MAG: tRNA uridine-5-carboxymethylaminomethyl(34) synthesis GTPase MnmE [Phycisphaerae bacterium]|nr:tRNA uridine-5-carboxymethylaminomethyl(34) synthesis GTPase MnmE [Phycisphaerae bacterium]
MFDLSDTVCAVASGQDAQRSIVRVTGDRALSWCGSLLRDPIELTRNGLVLTQVAAAEDLWIDAAVYVFLAPKSYTGQTLIELHVTAPSVLIHALLDRLLSLGIRQAGPGEFTARAYLNGKIDLAQAEAVNDVISGTNSLQLAAAERLLSGSLSKRIQQLQADLLDLMSLLEAGMDFSEDDIEFVTRDQAQDRVRSILTGMQQLLDQSQRNETLAHLPSVGIAGVPNAGKSSLFNALLGQDRSVVSNKHKTTRDVLAHRFGLPGGDCVLFDCAGLIQRPDHVLDQLAQQAAVESLRHCHLVLFCADVTKSDWAEDLAVFDLIPECPVTVVPTKIDLLVPDRRMTQVALLKSAFNKPAHPVSSLTREHLEDLTTLMDQILFESQTAAQGPDMTLLTARHRHMLSQAIESMQDAEELLSHGMDDVACMTLRATYQSLGHVEQHVDEQVLATIFSRFCIGK